MLTEWATKTPMLSHGCASPLFTPMAAREAQARLSSVHRLSRSARRYEPNVTAAVLQRKPGLALKDGGERGKSFGQRYWSCTCTEEVGLGLEYVDCGARSGWLVRKGRGQKFWGKESGRGAYGWTCGTRHST